MDIVFMDLMMPVMDGIEATRKIREFDGKVMIVAVTALDDEHSKEQMLRYGAEDYLVKPIDPKIFPRRVELYTQLARGRHVARGDNRAVNPFEKNVYNRMTLFRVFDESSLGEVWEYFLADSHKQVDGLTECIRVLYGLGSWMLKGGISFTITSEENDEFLFLTQDGVASVRETVVRDVLLKHYPQGRYMIRDGALAFMLKKRPLAPAAEGESGASLDEALSEDEKTVLRMSHTEKVTAEEYVESTPVDLMDKIEALEETEDRIDLAVLDFEEHPGRPALEKIGKELGSYYDVIDELFEFQHLAFAIESLAKFLPAIPEEKLEPTKNKKLAALVQNVLMDLSNWRKTIFISKETKDIHYLDSSLLSSCLQIEMIFDEKPADDEDELELF